MFDDTSKQQYTAMAETSYNASQTHIWVLATETQSSARHERKAHHWLWFTAMATPLTTLARHDLQRLYVCWTAYHPRRDRTLALPSARAELPSPS